LREVKEETSLNVKLVGDRLPTNSDLIRPFGIQLNIIKSDEHEHFDLIYLALPFSSTEEQLNKQESDGIGWFSLQEIEDENFDSFEKNKKWCEHFANHVENNK
jgi:8-oxo-dGTP pyrophosphatase MutT (NUDIX family)